MMAGATLFLFIAILGSYLHLSSPTPLPRSSQFTSCNKTTTWTNNNKSFLEAMIRFSDGSTARFILFQEAIDYTFFGPIISAPYGFGLCFHCASSSSCHLSIVFAEMSSGSISTTHHQVVWSANRNRTVCQNAVLAFSRDGGLALADADGSQVWSTGTRLPSVAGMSINENGNLVLFNRTNGTVWQSFDHPTDTLLPGQTLKEGQVLTSRPYCKNLSFYLRIDRSYLSVYASGGHAPVRYLTVLSNFVDGLLGTTLKYVAFRGGDLVSWFDVFVTEGKQVPRPATPIPSPNRMVTQFLRLDSDGGLRIYGLGHESGWGVVHYFSNTWDECQFPLKCGKFGVCRNGQCTCPPAVGGINFFVPVDSRFPDLGCTEVNQSSYLDTTPQSRDYKLVDFGALSYFAFYDRDGADHGIESEAACVDACAKEASCKAAFFKYAKKEFRGYCYLVPEVLSIMDTSAFHDYVSTHIKVRVPPNPLRVGATFFSMSKLLLIAVVLVVTLSLLLRRSNVGEDDEVRLKKVMSKTSIRRFSYGELSMATENFSEKLGGGGFGQVFKGVLRDGTEIAVKRLENIGQGTKEFLAEVETIGNVNHVNLVRLIGLCIENTHRIIVYEYLSNGSLDKWIFHGNKQASLAWETRKKILHHIARGLAYIHEECRQRIAHLDVKPHNILIDEDFNAKLSDFGMAKIISIDESQVMTRIRGTLGYLAPEWQGSRITVKADIYSYGILVLEVVSGRMVLDYSQPEPDIHLLKLLQRKSMEDRLMDIVDGRCGDLRQNSEECVEMIKLGLWCLHNDYRRRPAMSSVVKVLEGVVGLEPNFTYNFSSALSPVCPNTSR